MYDAYQTQISLCDELIAQSLQQLSLGKPRPSEALPTPRHRTRQPNALNFDVSTLLYQLVGIDLTQSMSRRGNCWDTQFIMLKNISRI